VATVPFQSLPVSFPRGIVEQHVQCMQSIMHHAQCATPSDSSWLHI